MVNIANEFVWTSVSFPIHSLSHFTYEAWAILQASKSQHYIHVSGYARPVNLPLRIGYELVPSRRGALDPARLPVLNKPQGQVCRRISLDCQLKYTRTSILFAGVHEIQPWQNYCFRAHIHLLRFASRHSGREQSPLLMHKVSPLVGLFHIAIAELEE